MRYHLTTDQSLMDIDLIHGQLTALYWSAGIPRETVARAIAHSLCFAIIDEAGATLAFARIITDRATFAYLCDVFVLEAYQGQGLSRQLMDGIIAHPDLQGLRRIVLATSDAHGLYAKYGFTPLSNPASFMEIWVPNIYQAPASEPA